MFYNYNINETIRSTNLLQIYFFRLTFLADMVKTQLN